MTTPATMTRTSDLGLICRHMRATGFKLAVVVGYARIGDKLRVCFWRAATGRWTLPTLTERADLVMLDEADHKRRRKLIATASQRALDLKFARRVWS